MRPGEAFTLLKEGQAVPGHPGTMVQPEQVVGPPRRGRRWAVVGPCFSSDLFARGVGELDGSGRGARGGLVWGCLLAQW